MNQKEMSEKKQIEEIRKDIFAAFGGYAKWEEDWQSLAEAVYNAGYRKQSEGEWVPCDVLPADEDGEWTSYACSMCKHTTDSYYRDVHDLSRYCPNCGAKMKGGE